MDNEKPKKRTNASLNFLPFLRIYHEENFPINPSENQTAEAG